MKKYWLKEKRETLVVKVSNVVKENVFEKRKNVYNVWKKEREISQF
jgi:hypothetical protein